MVQNKKYVFAQRDVDDFSCIKLTEAPYSDIIYTYTNVKFASEENANGQLPLKFTYEIKKALLEGKATYINKPPKHIYCYQIHRKKENNLIKTKIIKQLNLL